MLSISTARLVNVVYMHIYDEKNAMTKSSPKINGVAKRSQYTVIVAYLPFRSPVSHNTHSQAHITAQFPAI